MHNLIVAATYSLLTVALVLAGLSWYRGPDLDRASITLALLAAVTGLVLDRWVASRERRQELLRALANELHVASNLFRSPEMQPGNVPPVPFSYARVSIVCLQTCLASGAFVERYDLRLLKLMYAWLQRAAEFNDKLDATEKHGMSDDPARRADHHRSVSDSPTTNTAREALQALKDHLVERYERETGIGRDTHMMKEETMDASEPNDGTRRSNGRIALGISILALMLSGWQFFRDQDYKERLVRPTLAFSFNLSPEGAQYDLGNIGPGPAIVKWFEVRVDDEPKTSWAPVFEALGAKLPVQGVHWQLPEAYAWPPDARRMVLRARLGPEADRLRANHKRLDMIVCYCSVLDACWIASSLDPEAVSDVNSCEPKPRVWFGKGMRQGSPTEAR